MVLVTNLFVTDYVFELNFIATKKSHCRSTLVKQLFVAKIFHCKKSFEKDSFSDEN